MSQTAIVFALVCLPWSESFDFRLTVTEQPIGHEPYFPRRGIKTELVPPGSQRFENCRLPFFQLDVRNGWKSGVQHAFKIRDAVYMSFLEPRRVWIFTKIERLPRRIEPISQTPRKLKSELSGSSKQFGIVKTNRGIDINDNLAIRVDCFDAPDVLNVALDLRVHVV